VQDLRYGKTETALGGGSEKAQSSFRAAKSRGRPAEQTKPSMSREQEKKRHLLNSRKNEGGQGNEETLGRLWEKGEKKQKKQTFAVEGKKGREGNL